VQERWFILGLEAIGQRPIDEYGRLEVDYVILKCFIYPEFWS
jgi:hypothetical protein